MGGTATYCLEEGLPIARGSSRQSGGWSCVLVRVRVERLKGDESRVLR